MDNEDTLREVLTKLESEFERMYKVADKKASSAKTGGFHNSFTRHDATAQAYFYAMCRIQDELNDLNLDEGAGLGE